MRVLAEWLSKLRVDICNYLQFLLNIQSRAVVSCSLS